jgi:peptide/nickel transport system permease protein
MAVVAVVCLIALLAPLVSPHDPIQGSLTDNLEPPAWLDNGTWSYPLGTDNLGRDVLSRLIYGARVSVVVALLAIVVAGTFGTGVGLVAGYYGGWTDTLLMRSVDLMLSMPLLLVAFVFAVVWGPSFANVIAVLALFFWAQYARQVRGEVLVVREIRQAGARRRRLEPTHHVAPFVA